jgi:hypothetical protein
MKYEIENVYQNENGVNEFSVAINGLSYLVIFGRHVNGGFCAMPREGVSCELSAYDDFGDIGYNTDSINRKIKSRGKAQAIAEAVHVVASFNKKQEELKELHDKTVS